MDPEDNGIHLPGAHGQPVEAPEQGLNDALNPVRAEEPPQAAPDAEAIRRRRLMDQFLCNLCRNGARGTVITTCGHLFCWACLWPCLAERRDRRCPRCQFRLILDKDIIPVYGRPDDGDNVAEPGAVPRPVAKFMNPVHLWDPFLPQDVEPEAAEICRTLPLYWCLACVIFVGLLLLFVPLEDLLRI